MPSLLRLARRRTSSEFPASEYPSKGSSGAATPGPLPEATVERVRLSADLLAALLEVDQRTRATLDDLEWADAVADRLLRRRAARQAA